MKKKLMAMAVLTAVFFGTNAQSIKLGPKLGLNLPSQSWSASETGGDDQKAPWDAEGVSKDTKIGFQVGAVANIGLTEALSVRPELIFTTKGVNYSSDQLKVTTTTNYLELPVNVSYGFPIGDNKLEVVAGPYFSYGIGGKFKMDFEDNTIIPDIDGKLKAGKLPDKPADETLYYNPLDVGLNVGAAFQVSNILISANYGFGFVNTVAHLETEPDGYDRSKDAQGLYNRNFSLSVAYLFGGE